jgi:hypothetical protein
MKNHGENKMSATKEKVQTASKNSHEKSIFSRGIFLLWPAIIISLAIVISTWLVVKTFEKIKKPTRSIEVKGFAKREIKSDSAIWSLNFKRRETDLQKAYIELEKDMKKILAYLSKSGIKEQEWQLCPIDTQTLYKFNDKGKETNQIDAYVLSRTIKITSSNVELVMKISGECTSLIKEGIHITSYSPQFFYSDLEPLKIELLGEATGNALERCTQIAEKSGSKVGIIVDARQGVFQITPVNSTSISDYGEYNTSTIEKSVKAVVTTEFYLEDK